METGYNLGLQQYPIFDESHREELNKKIIDHYYFREIGFETPGLFVNRLNTRMNEIMPYYNQLFESELLKFSPITNYAFDETLKRTHDNTTDFTNTSTAHSTSTTHGTNTEQADDTTTSKDDDTINKTHKDDGDDSLTENLLAVRSDTPQNLLTVEDITQGALYATDVTRNANIKNRNTKNDITETETALRNKADTSAHNATADSTSNGTSDTNGTDTGSSTENKLENVIRHLEGYNSISGSQLLLEFRNTLLNIDMMIVDELSDLFMNIW